MDNLSISFKVVTAFHRMIKVSFFILPLLMSQPAYANLSFTQVKVNTTKLNGIAYGSNIYVAVGELGTIESSVHGKTWLPRTSETSNKLTDVVWSGSKFVAVGALGTIITSLNGSIWTLQSSGTSANLNSVVWNGSQFVAVGEFNSILMSTDGVNWTLQNSGLAKTHHFNNIIWTGSEYYVVGGEGGILSGTILKSIDGNVWNLSSSNKYSTLYDIAWNDSLLVAVGLGGNVVSSTDGVTWVSTILYRQSVAPKISYFAAVNWDGIQFVTFGANGDAAKSPDGVDWIVFNTGELYHTSDVVGVATTIVTVGSDIKVGNYQIQLNEVFAVPTPSSQLNISYTFRTDTTGDLSFSGGCSSNTKTAVQGVNTVELHVPTVGVYQGCMFSVLDLSGYQVSAHSISPFVIVEPVSSMPPEQFPLVESKVQAGENPIAITSADLNGDGYADLVVANQRSSDISTLLSRGDGSFHPAKTFALKGLNPSFVSVSDLNNDGIKDLVVTTTHFLKTNVSPNYIEIFIGVGSGGFREPIRYVVGVSPQFVACVDLNNDGYVDLAVANTASHDITLLFGDGTGSMPNMAHYSVGSTVAFISYGDYDIDGNNDLAVSVYGDDKVRVLYGDGSGLFSRQLDIFTGGEPIYTASLDLNNDGYTDIVAANEKTDNINVLLGDGFGGFLTPRNYKAGAHPTSVAWGDFNGDMIVDIAVANGVSKNVSVLTGSGNGGFSSLVNYPLNGNPQGITSHDFDSDGKPDLGVVKLNSQDISILMVKRSTLDNDVPLTSQGRGLACFVSGNDMLGMVLMLILTLLIKKRVA